jgi:hypothetical protein
MKTDEKKALRALVNNITLNEHGWRDEVIRALIETAFFYSPSYQFIELKDIEAFISTEFKLKVQELEIFQALEYLTGKSIAKTTNVWTLTNKRIKEITEQISYDNELETKVKTEWLTNLHSLYPAVSESNLEPLWLQLIDGFIGKLFMRLGVECFNLIGHKFTLETRSYSDLLSKIENNVADTTLKQLIIKEFPDFFAPDNKDRIQYLMGIFDYSLAQYSLGLDKNILDSLYKKPLEFILFLDTNFLFSLCGLNDYALKEAAKLIISCANNLTDNIRVKYYFTDVTNSEYLRTIDAARMELAGSYWSSDLSKAALNCKDLKGLTRIYHLSNAIKTIDPEIFFTQYLSPVAFFKNLGIQIYHEKFLEMKFAQNVIDDIHAFQTYLEKQNASRQWETIEHDVLLWHIARKKRSAADSFIDAKYFVLTQDYKLTRFDNYKQRQLGYKTSICMLPNHFYEVLRFFIPRSTDFETAFLHSLRMPLVRTTNKDKEKIAVRILQTLALYSDLPYAVACDILTDQATNNNVSKVIDQPEKVLHVVDDSLGKKLRDLQAKQKGLETQTKVTIQEKQSLESDVRRLAQALEKSSGKIKEFEGKIKERDETVNAMKVRFDAIEGRERQQNAQQELKRKERRAIFRLIGLFLILIFIFLLISYVLADNLTLPVKPQFYYFILSSISLTIWYFVGKNIRLGGDAKMKETNTWRVISKNVKYFIAFVITVGSIGAVWQAYESLSLVFRR